MLPPNTGPLCYTTRIYSFIAKCQSKNLWRYTLDTLLHGLALSFKRFRRTYPILLWMSRDNLLLFQILKLLFHYFYWSTHFILLKGLVAVPQLWPFCLWLCMHLSLISYHNTLSWVLLIMYLFQKSYIIYCFSSIWFLFCLKCVLWMSGRQSASFKSLNRVRCVVCLFQGTLIINVKSRIASVSWAQSTRSKADHSPGPDQCDLWLSMPPLPMDLWTLMVIMIALCGWGNMLSSSSLHFLHFIGCW